MDIGSLDNQQLLRMMIFSGAGALAFAVIFVFALVLSVRNWRKRHAAPTASASPVENGGTDTMPLLKSYGQNPPSPDEPSPPKMPPSPPPPPAPAKTVELLRVLMVEDTRQIIVEVDGVQYQNLQAIASRTIGQRILESAAALLNFTRGIIATADGTKSIPIPAVKITPWQTDAPAAPAPSGAVSADVLAQRQKFLDELGSHARAAQPPAPPQTTPRRGLLSRRKAQKKEEPVIAPFNLAEQIDEILQAKLLAHGVTTEMKIHSVPGGGIRIQVGSDYFETVDAVTDGAAQSLIKAAISEWEKR
ncbi:MAG TPA: hypothetical protein ENJ48_01540 [Anaerolineae bacterium]|nr:hypothetical protein [Anaerolineae bacterium]